MIFIKIINDYINILLKEKSKEHENYKNKSIILKFIYNFFQEPRDKRKELEYLKQMDNDEFYELFCAYTIGSEIITIPDCLNDDIRNIGGIENYFTKNVSILKNRLPIKDDAVVHFKDKDCNFVIESLDAFKNKFLYTESFLKKKLLIIELLEHGISINKIHLDIGVSPFVLSKIKIDNNKIDYIDSVTLEKLYTYGRTYLSQSK